MNPYSRKKRISFLLIAALCILASCNLSLPTTSLWFYTSDNPENERWNTSNFIYFQKDGTYTSDFGKFDYGKWQKRGKEIYLTNYNQQKSTLKIKSESWRKLFLNFDGDIISFKEYPTDFNKNKNPFSVNYNKWRMPATKRETDEELKQRLINHCEFWQLYFKWGLDNNVSALDVRSIPSVFKVYGNGIAVTRNYEIPKQWRSYFYDSTDSEKAREMVKNVFRKNDIRWPDTKNTFKLYLSAFEQIEYYLKK